MQILGVKISNVKNNCSQKRRVKTCFFTFDMVKQKNVDMFLEKT